MLLLLVLMLLLVVLLVMVVRILVVMMGVRSMGVITHMRWERGVSWHPRGVRGVVEVTVRRRAQRGLRGTTKWPIPKRLTKTRILLVAGVGTWVVILVKHWWRQVPRARGTTLRS